MPLSFGQRKRHSRQRPISVCTTAYVLLPSCGIQWGCLYVVVVVVLAPSSDGAGRPSPEHVAGSRKLILRPDGWHGWRRDLQSSPARSRPLQSRPGGRSGVAGIVGTVGNFELGPASLARQQAKRPWPGEAEQLHVSEGIRTPDI